MQLKQLVSEIHDEIAARGKAGIAVYSSDLALINSNSDSLIAAYDQELISLIDIYDDLQHLLKIADYGGDIDQAMQVLDAKADIASALENRRMFNKGLYTPERVGTMVDEYTAEMDSLLNIYDDLDHLHVLARAKEDEQSILAIREQKRQLLKILSRWGSLGPLSEEDYIRYNLEMERVHTFFQDVRKEQETKLTEEAGKLDSLQQDLLGTLDRSIYDLMVKAGYSVASYPAVSQFIDAWKAERLIEIKARLTESQLIWNDLVVSATEKQRDAMLDREIKDAILNYSDGFYRTAEYQLTSILKNYSHYYKNLIPVEFYIAECHLNRHAYQAARELYLKIVDYPEPTPYRVESLVRLMQYEKDLGTTESFFTNYRKVLQNDTLATAELLNYAHYLAGNKYYSTNRHSDALTTLSKISSHSQFYDYAQLLLAVVYSNLNDYEKAIPIYQKYTKDSSYPWSADAVTLFRNTAFMQLGLIYYQQRKYGQAIRTLQKVSPGFDQYDRALIAMAWSHHELEEYEQAIARATELLTNYLASDYTYEALVLTAHCNKMLDEPERAMDAYRYVVRAYGILDMRRNFDSERTMILSQVQELNRMESQALERREVEVYDDIDQLRNELNEYLLRVKEKGDTGSELLKDYYDERIDIVEHLFKLDEIIEWAQRLDRPEIEETAVEQRDRLIKVLETHQADLNIVNTAFLVDFPLAAKEASMHYKMENWSEVYRDLEAEKRRIERNLNEIRQFQESFDDVSGLSARLDMEILEFDINNLRDRLSSFQKAMADRPLEEPKSDLENWSDLSGFGMSDIVYNERKRRLVQIDDYALRIKSIESILTERRLEIENKLDEFEEEIKKLQDTLLSRKIQIEQLERARYIENQYFDTKESEEETWEDRLLKQNSQ